MLSRLLIKCLRKLSCEVYPRYLVKVGLCYLLSCCLYKNIKHSTCKNILDCVESHSVRWRERERDLTLACVRIYTDVSPVFKTRTSKGHCFKSEENLGSQVLLG